MNHNGDQKRILTIPNFLSLLRIVLIPVIVYVYLGRDDELLAGLLLAVACLTDLLDGWIARRFHMISDLGKILDVVADKLMQVSILLCAAVHYRQTLILVAILVIKECTTGYYCLRYIRASGEVDGAQWFGKVSTAVLDVTVVLMCLFRDMPPLRVWLMVGVCAVLMLFSFFRYFRCYRKLLANSPRAGDEDNE